MDSIFEVHMLNEKGKEDANEIANAFDQLLNRLNKVMYPGRETAIVRTKLEEACFYAKKSMANIPGNQQ